MTVATLTGSSAVTVKPLPNGSAVLESGSAWFSLFRALADLYLAGEIDADTLVGEAVSWTTQGRKLREFDCPAAKQLAGHILLAMDEPDYLCDPYRETPCGCPPMDRRARLRELIGA